MEKFLIVANGPFLARSIIEELADGRTIIALDGASDRLGRRGIIPNVILGDFDSVEENNVWGIKQTFPGISANSAPYQGKYGVTIVPAKDQNQTDLSKAIRYCDRNGTSQIDIVCATGGRIDHSIGNIRSLRTHFKRGRPIFIHSEQQSLFCAKNEKTKLQGEPGDHCGVFAFPGATISSSGFKYDVGEYRLEYGISESSCNQIVSHTATIDVTGEVLVVHPPMLKAQRLFSKLSQKERLVTLLEDEQAELYEEKLADLEKAAKSMQSTASVLKLPLQTNQLYTKLHRQKSEESALLAMTEDQHHLFSFFKSYSPVGKNREDILRDFCQSATRISLRMLRSRK